MKKYLDTNVLEESQKRISYIFDEFEEIIVSVSSGKDSTVLYYLALEEAIKRDRKIKVFFLDQEAEYKSIIDVIEKIMIHPNVIPMWYQVEIYLTNATSSKNDLFLAWDNKADWIRNKNEISIKNIDGKYPKRFYDFFEWFEKNHKIKTANLIGLRAEESLNRFRAISKNPAYKGINWSSKTKNNLAFKFYPIYDWSVGDIWKYISDSNVEYNKIYDLMFQNNHGYYNTMRVSNLIHEKSFKSLIDLQVLEPDTYQKIINRIDGTHCASIYANDMFLYNVQSLPKGFESWIDYRDYLLSTLETTEEKKQRIKGRFKETDSISIIKKQIRQILLNDWENNLPVTKEKSKQDIFKRWRLIL